MKLKLLLVLMLIMPAYVMAFMLGFPRAMMLYDQSGREATLFPSCDYGDEGLTLNCTLVSQYLDFMNDEEYQAKIQEIDKELQGYVDEGENILESAQSVCNDYNEFGQEAAEKELIDRYSTEGFREIGSRYIDAMKRTCSVNSEDEGLEIFREVGVINADIERLSCSVGLFVSELEFTISENKQFWISESQGEINGCDFVTTSTLKPYDNRKWEYKQSRVYLDNSCEELSSNQSYKTDAVKTFEVDCKSVGFSPLPY